MDKTKTFVDRSIIIHNNKYDYSLVEYIHSKGKVKIICPDHGDFFVRADMHIQGVGCPSCKIRIKPPSNRYTTKTFIQTANKVHKNKYNYALTEYKHNRVKIKIICPIHGDFEQYPQEHLRYKIGCQKCAKCHSYTEKEFIENAKQIHGTKYDYSKTFYKKCMEKLIIICPIHGEFLQTPNSHISKKSGCKKCADAKNGFTKEKFLNWAKNGGHSSAMFYIIECTGNNEKFYKIGITLQEIKQRYSGVAKMPYQYKVLSVITDTPESIWDLEKTWHKKHKEFHYIPDIKFGGSTKECFSTLLI